MHIHVDKASLQGNVYLKCPSLGAARCTVVALHGQSFDGRVITVNYVPKKLYHKLFPESARAQQALQPRTSQ